MDDANKIQEKIFDELYEDIVNISRVLPNLTPLDLQTELLELKNDPDRVTIILRKHFRSYNEDRENIMSQDIKMIKRVLPNLPIVQISNDLGEIGFKKNRVQLVLKKYFSEDVNPHKRLLNNTDTFLPNKILKLEEPVNNNSSPVDPIVMPADTNDQYSFISTSPIKLEIDPSLDFPNPFKNYELPTKSTDADTTTKLIIENNNLNSSITPTTIENTTRNLENPSQDTLHFPNVMLDDISLNLPYADSNKEQNIDSDVAIANDTNKRSYYNDDEGKSIFEVVNSYYPDLTFEQVDIILSHLDINILDCADGTTLVIVLNEMLNYFENKQMFEHVDAINEFNMDCDMNLLVETNPQSNESASTEEYELKDELNFLQIPVKDKSTVEQESLFEIDTPYLSKNDIAVFNHICHDGRETNQKPLETQGFVESLSSKQFDNKCELTKNEEILNNCTTTPFINIAPNTDNWVKSALGQTQMKNNLESTIVLVNKEREKLQKRSIPSTVTSASDQRKSNVTGQLFNNLSENSFGDNLDVPQPQVIKLETPLDVMGYPQYGLDSPLEPLKGYIKNESWLVNYTPNKRSRNIERPPRDNLKSSLNNHFSVDQFRTATNIVATSTKPVASTSSKNFVQYLENRNLENQYLINNRNIQNPISFEGALPNPPVTIVQNNNFGEQKFCISKQSNLFSEDNDKDLKVLFCTKEEECNMCDRCKNKKSLKSLKIRNDLFRKNLECADLVVDLARKKSRSSPVPIIDITECNSSESDPLPGTSSALQPNENHPFFSKIMEMFPDICPDFLRKLCFGKDQSDITFDNLISILLEGNYNRRERPTTPVLTLEFDDQYKTLLDLFPDADPTYLQHHCERLFEHPNDFKEFVASLLEHKNYPSKEEYLKKMKLSAQQKQYTTEFDVKKFLEVIPNPEEYFHNRAVKRNYPDQDYALTFLKNHYCHLTIKDICTVFKDCNFSIVKASVVLDNLKKTMKSKRRLYPLTSCLNIPLLQELAYIKHKEEILNYMKMQDEEKKQNRQYAKNSGLLKSCECCYDDEVMPGEMACCENDHIFCKECVKKGCEVKIGEGKLDFPCLTSCDAKFSLQVLQTVLSPKVFSKMAQRKQLEEVKAAGIEDLEFCPFCDFATIPAHGDKLFRCLNSDCMKESCRECKEPSHIPLRCDEVEKENDVKLRTYIEDKMTEALVRKCYQCEMKFIKEEGCNKMTCSCGAMMCYVCKQPVKDYKHFNGQGGDQFHLCPLYSDTQKLHMEAVKLSAETAKKELGIANNQLKIDPATNIDQHYKMLATRNPPNLPPGMEQINPQHIHIRIREFHLERH